MRLIKKLRFMFCVTTNQANGYRRERAADRAIDSDDKVDNLFIYNRIKRKLIEINDFYSVEILCRGFCH